MTMTYILASDRQRATVKRLVDEAPPGAVVTISAPRRSAMQNRKLHAMLSDISKAQPEGRCHTPETWKALAMHACGHAVQFEHGIDGGPPFPVGFRSSRLSVKQMAELIEFLYAYGARHGVAWSDEVNSQGREFSP